MNDQDRALIEQVLRAAGTAGTEGWGYLIRWMVWDGIVGVVTGAAFVSGSLYLLRRAFRWKPKAGYDADMGYLFRGLAIVVLCGIIIGSSCGIASSLVQIIAPQGAAIHSAIHHS